MDSLENKVVLITGASSGIGRSCARASAREGARLMLAGRRLQRLEDLAAELNLKLGEDVFFLDFDVRDQTAVERAVNGLPEKWKGVDVLVNNAGLARGLDKLHEGKLEDWEEMIDTNIKGLLYVSRAVIPGMVERGSGHIINIGSIAGHEVYPGGNVYCATKFAVDALSKGMRLDLSGTGLRVSQVSPGMVETEFSRVRFRGDSERAEKVYQGLTPLSPDDIADAVVYCATRPPHVNVSELIVMPTAQASATLAHRK
ncbi:MAG: SDR family oxidoreductase [Candidatus Aminicenantes bacterium]|nr:SDR family oxidoreductase [Candidatus Aminicenantes bacterium]